MDKLQELLAMGFIQQDEYDRRASALSPSERPDRASTGACACAAVQCDHCFATFLSCVKEDHLLVCLARPSFPCPLAWKGCRATFAKHRFSAHVEECEYAVTVCRMTTHVAVSKAEIAADPLLCIPGQGIPRAYLMGRQCFEALSRKELSVHMVRDHEHVMSRTQESTRSPNCQSKRPCPLTWNGCTAVVPPGEISAHLMVCRYNVVACKGAMPLACFDASMAPQDWTPEPQPRGIMVSPGPYRADTATDRMSMDVYRGTFDGASDNEDEADARIVVKWWSTSVWCNNNCQRQEVAQHYMDGHQTRRLPVSGVVWGHMHCPVAGCARGMPRHHLHKHLKHCLQFDVSCARCGQESIGHHRDAQHHRCTTPHTLPFPRLQSMVPDAPIYSLLQHARGKS